MKSVEQIAEQMFGVFDSVFGKVQKRALSEQEQNRLRQEIYRLCGLVGELSQRTVFEQIDQLQKEVMKGFELIEQDMKDLSARIEGGDGVADDSTEG